MNINSGMNTAVLRLSSAELIGLAGRLFEAELNGDDTDRAIIMRHMRKAIAEINQWEAQHLAPVAAVNPKTPLLFTSPEPMTAEAANV